MDENEQYKGESEYEEDIFDDQQDTTESVEEIKPFFRNNSVPISDEQVNGNLYMTSVESQQSSSDNNEIIVPNETIISQSSDNVHLQHQENDNSSSVPIYHQDNNCTLQTQVPIALTTNLSTTNSRPSVRRSFIQSPISGSQCSNKSHFYSQQTENHHNHHHHSDQKINGSSSTSEHSMSVNYFLMDIQLQMEKLNDLAQIELKIEIQKLILEKLRNPNNLR